MSQLVRVPPRNSIEEQQLKAIQFVEAVEAVFNEILPQPLPVSVVDAHAALSPIHDYSFTTWLP